MNEKSELAVKIIAVHERKNCLWVVQELMDCSVYQLLSECFTKGFESELAIKYVLRKILMGLDVMHSNNIIHLDIKSDNILVGG